MSNAVYPSLPGLRITVRRTVSMPPVSVRTTPLPSEIVALPVGAAPFTEVASGVHVVRSVLHSTMSVTPRAALFRVRLRVVVPPVSCIESGCGAMNSIRFGMPLPLASCSGPLNEGGRFAALQPA